MRIPFRYVNSLVAGTYIVNISYPTPARLTRLYVEVDNTVTISDNFNLIQGVGGSNSLSLESVYDTPIDIDLGISPIALQIVTTVTTKIAIYADIEVMR